MSIKFQVGNVHTTVNFPLHERDNIGAILQKFLTVDVPGAKFLWAYKSGQWDGKARLFEQPDLTSFRFQTGMFPAALAAITAKGYQWEFEDCRWLTPQPPTPQLQPYTVPLRPYQHEVLSAAFASQLVGAGWWPRGILQVATGGGKTEIAVAMYQTYPVETIFLVHRKDLLLQAQERFASYGIQAGIIGSGKFQPHPNLNIITMQTLYSIVKENGPRLQQLAPLLFNCKQLFFDEAHVMAADQDKGNLFVEIASWFPFAHARWGLTATAFMRDQYDNLLLEGVTGGILAKISTEWLIQNKYLTPPKVKMIRVPGKLPMSVSYKSSNKAKAEYYRKVQDKGITNNSWRNHRIALELTSGPFPCLCLVKTIEQAKAIQHQVQQAACTHATCNKGIGLHECSNVPLLTGASTAEQRRDMVAKLRNGEVDALIATTIFDEGVDIPEIMKLILGSGGKSQVKLLQRAGRGLRLAANKHEVIIVDFYDAHSPLLERHSLERKKIWKGECFEVEEIA